MVALAVVTTVCGRRRPQTLRSRVDPVLHDVVFSLFLFRSLGLLIPLGSSSARFALALQLSLTLVRLAERAW
jgi:hypothetical protein